MNSGKRSRREFLRNIAWLIALPYVLLAGLSFKRQQQLDKKELLRIPKDIPEGVSFQDDVIIVNEKNSLSFLSSKCTHLGCKINSRENNMLICPCHGSHFSFEGNVLKGPAREPLQQLNYNFDSKSDEWIVKL